MKELAEATLKLTDGLCNWTIVAYPNEGWARTVFGEPDVERLWQAVSTAVRLDEPDPVAAWREHMARSQERAAVLNERRFDALRYRGPGTDFLVGLHPGSMWQAAQDESRGIKHVANMPTEEVFTTPDARRADGTVRSTLPLQIQGNIVRDLEVRFEGGRAVEIRAVRGRGLHADARRRRRRSSAASASWRSSTATSRVGQTGLVFFDTLFDENASSHIALGASIVQAVEGATALTATSATSAGSTTHRSTPTS